MIQESASPDDAARKREALTERIADIVLDRGLAALALRGLAAALGTSGRMLLYYFGSKDALVRQALLAVSARLDRLLAAYADGPPMTPGALAGAILARAQQPEVAPFMRVWTEVVAAGARGEAPFDDIAAVTVRDWIGWIEGRLLPEHRGTGMAEALLSFMDGVTLLELARPGTTAAARALLPGLLDGHGGDGQSVGRSGAAAAPAPVPLQPAPRGDR